MVQQQPDLSATSDKNQNYSRALWEKSPTAQVVLQADGTILDVNQAFVDLLDITPIKILGLNIWDLTSPADQADRKPRAKCTTARWQIRGDTILPQSQWTSYKS